MNVQQTPFKLYSRLINNRSQLLISLQDLHIAIDEGMPLSATLKTVLTKLDFILNQDYLEISSQQPDQPIITFLVTPETALIYLNTFETTAKIKHCIKIIVQLLQRNLKESPEFIQNELAKQHCITQTTAFLNTYFQYDRHFLISEDDFMLLERMKGACTVFEQMLLEVNNNRSLSYEALADLFSCCTTPLFDVLKRIKNVSNEADQIRALANN